MTLERRIARIFQLDDETWLAHANPWSVIMRNTVLPMIILAAWSRVWIGLWSIAIFVLALFWNWYNPRIFPKPKSTDNWASKAVFGERLWLNRDVVPVPKQHRRVPNILSGISGVGAVFLIWGLVVLNIWITLFGATLVYAKLWFLDRMVWIFEDMSREHPEYKSWVYTWK